ncbi:hypothetical protein HELRODRAFT_186289 [Helobdella robusta]|uniref:Pre-mRNA-splicing factor SPF27 n=1 Tax=Helobdella robusta TaxID=6412 RepID=T1FNX5_HELRO|nr:hypothetical protein HELRODRAFT_186289 [Helobdella robusta]ESO09770.1 hypothetical protein HELRODRAFT_186289 [Helobdella robusta]
MSGEVVVDALPYFDQGYEAPGVQEAASALVDEEMRRYRPAKNYLEFLPNARYDAFETAIMKNEFARLQMGQPMEMLSMKRYELPQPSVGRLNDVTAWKECVDNSEAQLVCHSLKIANLDLMMQYGTETWKHSIVTLMKLLQDIEHKLHGMKKKVQDINWQRKNEQMDVGAKLKMYEETWVSLVSKNYEIEQACQELEKELAELESQNV